MTSASTTKQNGDPTLEVGNLIRVKEERVVPLSPVGAFYLVDLPQEIEQMHDAHREALDAEGIGVVRLPEFDRAEWTGVFTYEVEIVLQVVMFFPTKGRTAEQVQLASYAWVLKALVAVAVLGVVGWTAGKFVTVVKSAKELIGGSFPLVAVALGFLAIALLVREVRKAKALTHGT